METSSAIIKEEIKCKIILQKLVINNALSGEVTICCDDELEIKHAFVEITGVGSCCWNLNRTAFRLPKAYFKGTRVEGNVKFYLARRTLCASEDYPYVHKGEQSYIFSVFWPARLPGTWLGDHGCIKYTGMVVIKLFNKEIYTHSQDLIVKSVRDLAKEQHLSFECRKDVTKKFFILNAAKKVCVSVWVPICGIAAGQSLPVLCTVENTSDLHYGGLIFILTRIDIYKSKHPVSVVKKVRTDVCRVARMVNIHKGRYNYYAVLHTDHNTLPTNQFYSCSTCQIIYELWLAVQAAVPHLKKHGNPDIHTPGIPIIIGTNPLINFNVSEVTATVLRNVFTYNPTLVIEEIPEDVKKIIDETEEELTEEAMIQNLKRQLLENEKALSKYKESAKMKRISILL